MRSSCVLVVSSLLPFLAATTLQVAQIQGDSSPTCVTVDSKLVCNADTIDGLGVLYEADLTDTSVVALGYQTNCKGATAEVCSLPPGSLKGRQRRNRRRNIVDPQGCIRDGDTNEVLTDDKDVKLCVKDQQQSGSCQTSTTVSNPFSDGHSTEICKSKYEKQQSSSGTGIVEAARPTSDYDLSQYPGQNLIPSTEGYQPTTNTEEIQPSTDPTSVQEDNPSAYAKELAFLDTTPLNEQTSAEDADTSTYYRRTKRGRSARIFKA